MATIFALFVEENRIAQSLYFGFRKRINNRTLRVYLHRKRNTEGSVLTFTFQRVLLQSEIRPFFDNLQIFVFQLLAFLRSVSQSFKPLPKGSKAPFLVL